MNAVRSGSIYALVLLTIMGGYAAYVLRQGTERAAEHSASRASLTPKHLEPPPVRSPSVTPIPSARRAMLRGEAPKSVSEFARDTFGIRARERRISELDAFQTFADSIQLNDEQRRRLVHILALYYENEDALITTSTDDDALRSMKLQLLGDTVAQLRSRMPDAAAWDAFVKTGLLIGIAPANVGPS